MSSLKIRWSLGLMLLAGAMNSGGAASTVSQPAGQTPEQNRLAEGLPPQVHLRKLHLVRPDLIPYPIEYEVYC